MAERMKCARCGKRFKQGNKKQVLCNECLAQERAAKKTGPQLIKSATGYGASGASSRSENRAGAGAPTPVITIVETTPPPEVGAYGARARTAERHTPTAPEQPPRPATPLATQPAPARPPDPRVAAPQTPKKPAPQLEKRVRQPRPPTPPYQLTDEVRATIERRYLELSQPVEFDGIRTQIAGELAVPKPVVKQVIKELRVSRQLPSWWELKSYKGDDDTLERIRASYLPYLPTPPIGVHKQIASDLAIEAPQVYQAIRRLRAEMKLPQYNPPETHENETPLIDNANTTLSAATDMTDATDATDAISPEP